MKDHVSKASRRVIDEATYQIQDCTCHDRVESRRACKVQEAVQTTEAYREDRCPDRKIARCADVREEIGIWNTPLDQLLAISDKSSGSVQLTSRAKAQVIRPAVTH